MFFNKIKARIKSSSLYLYVKNKTDNIFFKKGIICILIPIALFEVLFFDNIKFNENIKYNLTAAIIIKNEGKYITEWLNYYQLIGFDKIYLYDNESTDNTLLSIRPFIESGFVEYHKIIGNNRQLDAYNDALRRSKKESKYIAFLDADEFIFVTSQKESVSEIIDKLFSNDSKIGGVLINWLIFGSSNLLKAPNGLVTQNFVYRSKYNFPKNKHVKTICDPRKVEGVNNPHYVEYKIGYYSINSTGHKATGPFNKFDPNTRIRINHYFTKSKEEFLKKRARGMADKKGIRDLSDFKIHDKNDVYDDSMSRFKSVL